MRHWDEVRRQAIEPRPARNASIQAVASQLTSMLRCESQVLLTDLAITQ